MKNVKLIFVMFLFSLINVSEITAKPKKKRLIEVADSAFFRENFSLALKLYDEIIKEYHSNHYVQYHRYVAYHLSNGRGSDVDLIYEYEQNEGHVDKFYNYWLGRIHFNRYEFDIAEEHFKAFLKIKAYKTKQIQNETKNYLKKILKAKKFHHDLDEFQITPLHQVNSVYADVSPAFFGGHNELLFMSSRPVNGAENKTNKYRIFHSIKEGEDWKAPTKVSRFGVFDEKHTKIEVVNQDGRLFMFLDNDNGGLYYSEQNGDGWKFPIKFDSKIDEKTIDAHFFINDAEDAIYFSAFQEKNKLDLFESHFDEASQEWSAPKVLKGAINSRYNDDSPFLSHDGKYMYFSSNRRNSLGGYDIYKSAFNPADSSWSKAENLGFPINTIDDEINFQLNLDNISGYFSSNRLHTKGSYDIYYFHETGKIIASGTITDETTGLPLPNIDVEFHPLKYRDEFFPSTTDALGRYEMEIFENEEFIVQLSYLDQALSSSRVKSIAKDLHRNLVTDYKVDFSNVSYEKTDYVALYEGPEGEEYSEVNMLANKFRVGRKAILKNAYFDLHSYKLKKEARPVITQVHQLLITNPELVVEISGHTDNVGVKALNQTLSLKRAKSVKDVLVSKGIEPSRLLIKGYGDTMPLASNDDEIDGRELNRRIEIRIID